MKILIICTANSCRSQMAEAVLKRLDPNMEVFSTGTKSSEHVHPFTIKAMAEIGIDISNYKTKNIDSFIGQNWDYVITVCDIARKDCPMFDGNVRTKLFIKFDDPLSYIGDDDFLFKLVCNTRDKIVEEFEALYYSILQT